MGTQWAARRLAPGLEVHPLGVGCRAIGAPRRGRPAVTDEQWLEGLRRAAERGATLFDTADTYGAGRSERVLGRVVRELRRQGIPLQLSSKIGQRGSAPHPYAGRHLIRQLEQTMDNLAVERLDLYVLPDLDFGPNDCFLGSAIEQMETLRQLGSIGAVGIRGPRAGLLRPGSRKSIERFLQVFRLVRPDVILADFNALTPLSVIDGEEDLFAFAERSGAGVLVTTPLAGGYLAGRSDCWGGRRSSAAGQGLAEILQRAMDPLRRRFGDRPGLLVAAALRYCLSRGQHTAVLAGFGSPDHVSQNFDALDMSLTAADLALIDDMYARLRRELRSATAALKASA
nr:aldo/keto reductase [Kitasatospora purpeofusca]